MSSATSEEEPIWPTGNSAFSFANASSKFPLNSLSAHFCKAIRVKGVSTVPGQTAFTEILWGAKSIDKLLVIWPMAPLLAP